VLKAKYKTDERTQKEMMKLLFKKMQHPPNDKSPAQGELGLYNVYKAITEPSLLAPIQAAGMFRDDAALNIFFISDENDVCYDYSTLGGTPAYESKNGKVKDPTTGRDPVEQWTYDNICNDAVNGERLQPGLVFQALSKFKAEHGGKPLMISGAIYREDSTIPRCFANPKKRQNCTSGKTDAYADEKEIGHGYIDLIRMTKMDAVDLAKNDFGSQLASIGTKTEIAMRMSNTFECKVNGGGVIDNVNSRSFIVTIQGNSGPKVYKSECNDASQCASVDVINQEGSQIMRVTVPAEGLSTAVGRGSATVNMNFSQLRLGEMTPDPVPAPSGSDSPFKLHKGTKSDKSSATVPASKRTTSRQAAKPVEEKSAIEKFFSNLKVNKN
jgi:hypothetical protein